MQTNYRAIILLLLSIISCGLAQGLTIISVPWYFTDSLNLSSLFSLLYATITFIGLFWGLYAGVIIDVFNRKKILLYINWINGIVFGIIGIIDVFFDESKPFLIFLGFTMCSFYYIIFFPNLYALVQELTNKKQYVTINSCIEIFFQTTSIISAIICALLLSGSDVFLNYFNFELFPFEKWSIGQVFLLNSILYFITSFFLFYINYNSKKTESIPNISSTIKEIKKSIYFLIKKRFILIYGICSQIIFAFLIVELFSLLPLFVKNCLNETIITFALADVIYAAGAIFAGLITIKILHYTDKVTFVIFLIITTGYSILIMIKFLTLHIFFIATLIIGITNASARITRMSYFFEKIPNYLIGRTNTVFNSINTLIRGVLILVFSIPWFSEATNVIIGYKIGIYILIIFTIPLIWGMKKKLN